MTAEPYAAAPLDASASGLADEPGASLGLGSASDPTPPRVADLLDSWGEDEARRLEAANRSPATEGELPELDEEYGATELDSGDSPGGFDVDNLGLTRDVKSTSKRYRTAAIRVAAAMDVATDRLTGELRAADAGAWSAAGMKRWQRKLAKLGAHANRKERLVECCTGAVGVQVFACRHGCGEQYGAVMGCNVRVCPRCAPKLRRANQAKVLRIMEVVDELRRKSARPPATWRFVTLTVRSGPEFLPMRRFVGRAWGKLMRWKFWRDNVQACMAFFETTHTAKGWHVHVHALVDGFVPRAQLVQAWAKVTEGQGEPQGQHVSLPKGGRKAIARELAKYAAKDLGGACADEAAGDPWGVAGTPGRLAEFYLGSLRWRTLRTYGDAYDAAAHEDASQVYSAMLCECCGQPDMEYTRTRWVRAFESLATLKGSRPPP